MDNKKKAMPAWLVLTIITVIAALGLSLTNLATKDIIASRAAGEKNQALIALVPDADTFEDVEIPEGVTLDTLAAAKQGSKVLAHVAQTTVQGYAGPIEVISAVDADYNLLGISVGGSAFAETAGLGSKVQEPEFVDQYKGVATPVKMNSDVDQVSGATISSNAVNKAVNTTVDNIKIALGDTSGIVSEADKRANTLAALVPDANSFENQTIAEGSELDSFELAKSGDKVVAYVAQTTEKGFAGPIEVITATDLGYKVLGISVGGSDFAETEGLGSKVTEPEFTDLFKGLAVKAELNNNIDQISGATVSSKAVVDAVNKAIKGIKLANGEEIEEEPVVEVVKAELVPGADNYEEQVLADGALEKLEVAKAGDKVIGYVGQLSAEGFEGPIEVKLATDTEFKIVGIEVGGEKFAETEGLGSKVKDAEFKDQYIGLSAPIELNKDVDQVSSATISSKAVNDTVNAILDNVKSYFASEGAVTEEAPVVEKVLGLVPGADKYEEQVLADGALEKLEVAKAGDKVVGYVGQLSAAGFEGPIEVKLATDTEFKIVGIEVGGEKFAETEGLGSKVKEAEFKDQYIGLSAPVELNKDVDQVSSATISSKAVNDTVNAILDNVKSYFAVEDTVSKEAPVVEEAVTEETPVVEEVLGLVPGADKYEEQVLADGALEKLEVAKAGDKVIGYVGQLSAAGFEAPIEVKLATDTEFKIVGIEVGGEKFAETEGLGSKVKDAEFKDQYIGLSAPIELNKDVDQVSSATISSKAVNDTVNAILDNVKSYFASEGAVTEEAPVVEKVLGLVPGADKYEEQVLADGALEKLEVAKAADKVVGYVGQLSDEGFEAPIEVKLATDTEFKIVGIEVGGEKFAETEGLGSKVKEAEFKDQYIGLTAPIELNKDVDQVSSATISSKAVNDTVNAILDNIKSYFAVEK